MNERDSIDHHNGLMINTFKDYERASNDNMKFSDQMMHMLNSLPDSFSNIITDLETDDKVVSWTYLIQRLKDFEVRRKSVATTHPNPIAFNSQKNYKKKTCFTCGKLGHKSNMCWHRKKNDFGNQKN
jgi:hypothetical protein